jgi:hypothetical protein
MSGATPLLSIPNQNSQIRGTGLQHYQVTKQKQNQSGRRSNRYKMTHYHLHSKSTSGADVVKGSCSVCSLLADGGCHQWVCQLPLWKSMDGAKRQLSGELIDEQQQQQQLSFGHSRMQNSVAPTKLVARLTRKCIYPMTSPAVGVGTTAFGFD